MFHQAGVAGGSLLVDTSLSYNYAITPGEPFWVQASIDAYGRGLDDHQITSDFFNTATLSFNLPFGTTITSLGGYSQSASPIPEPTTMLLLGLGLIGLAGVRKKMGR